MPSLTEMTHGLNLSSLVGWLIEREYHAESIRRVVDHVSANGTLEGTVPNSLDREDEEEAERVLVESQPAHPPESNAWGSRTDEPSMWCPLDDTWVLGGDPCFPEATGDEPWAGRVQEYDREMRDADRPRFGYE